MIDRFADEYAAGRTPVPCSLCNQGVKFTDLIAFARELGADCLATGHYVRRVVERTAASSCGRAAIRRATRAISSTARPRDQLDYLRFPLGDLPKSEVRQLAAEAGLIVADKPDSQDICFVPDGDYAGLVKKLRPETAAPGEIVDLDGTGARPASGRGPFHHRPAPRDRDRRPARAALRRPDRARERSAWSSARAARWRSRRRRVEGINWLAEDQVAGRGQGPLAWRRRSPARWDGERLTFATPEYGVAPGPVGGVLRRRAAARRRHDRRDRGRRAG